MAAGSARIHVECRDRAGWIALDHPPLMGADESIALEDYSEGVAAFLEKRKPVWRNR